MLVAVVTSGLAVLSLAGATNARGKLLIGVSLACLLWITPVVAHTECVILLHGLFRTSHSMERMQQALVAEGYRVINQDYPSRSYPIEQLAEMVINTTLTQCPTREQVSFVTHSLGGILVRQYLSRHRIERLHRVVMLAPPNHGSEVIDRVLNNPLLQAINGPAGMQLGTGSESLPKHLGRANFELGIIAGTHSVNPLFSNIIPGPDDGAVSVESTQLEGMSDHLLLPMAHTFIMNAPEVITQTVHFLKYGKFQR